MKVMGLLSLCALLLFLPALARAQVTWSQEGDVLGILPHPGFTLIEATALGEGTCGAQVGQYAIDDRSAEAAYLYGAVMAAFLSDRQVGFRYESTGDPVSGGWCLVNGISVRK